MHKYAKEIIGANQSQIIQPWQFGHKENKATCLWLKGLPLLKGTKNVKELMKHMPKNETDKVHYATPGPDRWKLRSTTYQGIANAMAKQWGGTVVDFKKHLKKKEVAPAKEEHSEYGGSGAKKWMTCIGSTKLSRGMPNYENEASKDGTLGHKCLEFLLNNRKKIEAAAKMAAKTWQPHHIKHGLEAVAFVETYLKLWKTEELYVESKVDASAFTKEDQGGSLDIAIVAKKQRTLIIADYKFGEGIGVEAEENPQLICYALAMLLKLGWKNFDKVILIVIQPRFEHPNGSTNRVWVTTAANILAWGKKFKTAVKLAEAPGAENNLTPGEHCRFCLARIKCPKLKEEAMKQAQIDFAPSTNVIKKLPDLKKVDDIGKLLDACEKLQVFINAVKERAYSDAKRGLKVNGYKLVEKRTTRKWTNESKAAEAAFKALGKQAFTEPELLSPAQFEKKFKKYKSAMAFLNKNVTNKTGGTTLARADNKKKAIDIFEAEFKEL